MHIPAKKYLDAEYIDLMYNFNIQCLRVDEVPRISWYLQEYMLMFLNIEDNKTMSPQPKQKNRKSDLAFWVDILKHLNLIAILQENTFVHELRTHSGTSFQNKIPFVLKNS
jgi:hypothetical protein